MRTGDETVIKTDRKQEASKLLIRTAVPEDALQLLDIYAPYVRHTAITFEYEVPSPEEFRDRICHTLERYPYLVAEEKGEAVGYVYAGPLKERPAYNWAVETSIYVRQDKKGMGIGKALYQKLEYYLHLQNIVNLNACIACPAIQDEYLTRDSIAFHGHMGYRMVGEFHRCGYKFQRWYNMVWMEKIIGEHQKEQPPVRLFQDVIGAGKDRK